MSVDHRFLVQTMRELMPAFKALHEHEPERHGRLQEELSTVYDRHILVCERFVGERPSLLTARPAKKSGPSLIGQFKTLRMKTFDSSAHVARLHAQPLDAPAAHGSCCPAAASLGGGEILHSKKGQEES